MSRPPQLGVVFSLAVAGLSLAPTCATVHKPAGEERSVALEVLLSGSQCGGSDTQPSVARIAHHGGGAE